MACLRLIALFAAMVGVVMAGKAAAQTMDQLRPSIWDTEADVTTDDYGATGGQDQNATPPPPPVAPPTRLEAGSITPEPVPLPKRPPVVREDDPYGPLGWRLGGLTAYFALETGANFTDNVQQSANDRISDVGLLLAPSFRLQSDWERHSFAAWGSGQFVRYANESAYDTEEAEARADLRLDVLRTTTLDLASFYILTQETSSSINVPDNAIGTRNEAFYGGSVALEQGIGDFTTRLKTAVARQYYGDVQLPNNVTESGSEENYVELGLSLRGTYAPTPNMRPFVEVAYLPRYRDQKHDANGLDRNSDGYSAMAGLGFDPSPIWSGEMGMIYILRDYDDPALGPLVAFGPIGNVTWRPTELTSVVLSAATYLNEATSPDSSGTRNYSGQIDITHALRENIDLLGGFSASLQDSQGVDVRDITLTADAGFLWRITRWLAWKANYEFTWFDSNVAGSDYTENQVSVGIEIRN
jgi:hypothetical protein